MNKKVIKSKPAKKSSEAERKITVRVSKSAKMPQTVRGFKDILPVDQKYWHHIASTVEQLANNYSFEKIDLPILEDVNLFVRSVGQDSDIVQKEMFVFEDLGGDQVALRPEGTASVVRAYNNHGMLNLPQPVKLWYMGPMFRYERPQSGRYRQFHQFGFEVLGDASPVIDAQLMIMVHNFFKAMGVEIVIQVNSLGTPADRKLYKQKLVAYYKTQKKYLQEHDLENLAKNPLRLLDSKDEKMIAIREDAPQMLDFLSDESKKHLTNVLEYLDQLEIPYELNPYLVRGLDYYTQTVFEVWAKNDEHGGNMALGGGGRYDLLVEQLGGRPTAAAGFAIGIERAILKMKELEVVIPEPFKADIMVAQLGDAARRKSMSIFEELRVAGLRVVETFSKDNLKTQLDTANKRGVKYTLIIGQQELSDGTVLVRDMEGGVQETIPFGKITKEMKKRFGLEEVVVVKKVKKVV